ncbi:MAG: ISAzo13 family transposase, partial [Pseudomonadota bacterium]
MHACLKLIELERNTRCYNPLLNERCLRLWAATEARSLGHGGIKAVAAACRLSRRSIERGLSELQN